MGKFWDWLMDCGEYESSLEMFSTRDAGGLRCATRSYDRKKDSWHDSSLEMVWDERGSFLRLRTSNLRMPFEIPIKRKEVDIKRYPELEYERSNR